MTEPIARTRRRWVVFVPFALCVALALAWSAAWYLAARRADATIAAWIEQEARLGRVYGCGKRTTGGYPFRIEVRCADPTVQLAGGEAPRVLTAKELLGVAQVYQPDLIIAEITGPLAIADAGQPTQWRADWRLAQASLRGLAGRPERLSVVLDDARLERLDGNDAAPFAAANHFELHLRRDPQATQGPAVIDIAVQVAGATVPSASMLAGHPLDGEVTALVRGVSDWRPKPMPVRLKEWQAAGGRLEVTKLRLQQGDAVAIAAGEVGLSAAGRPDGTLSITMAGFDALVRDLAGAGHGGSGQLALIAGLSFLGRPAEIDGKRAIAVSLRVSDGAVFLGPIPLGKMAPLY
jgi:hypothetical protein